MQPYVGSIFEIFKAGAGPSSSHSMGPQRAAEWFLKMLEARPELVRITLYGSLAATGRGHMTDKSLAKALDGIRHEIVWDTETKALNHPNTLRFEAFARRGQLIKEWTVYSVGGGNLVDMHGLTGETESIRHPARDIASTISFCEDRGLNFWQYVERSEHDVWPRLGKVWDTMRESVERGLTSKEEFLPGPLKVRRRARDIHARAASLESPHRDISYLSSFALAVAEENAAGGVIVTAPTCGSAGILPGLLYYHETVKGVPRETILRALATAGLFGSVIRANASLSGAEVGCQGEVGSASSMAAAAGAQILGGNLRQIEYAAEIAMEHHLGLTCDPVEGYVQIPCIERNMTGCLRAFECASFVLSTDGAHLVSFDDAVEVMQRTGHDLQSAYRETAQGGLAWIWRRKAGREDAGKAEPKGTGC